MAIASWQNQRAFTPQVTFIQRHRSFICYILLIFPGSTDFAAKIKIFVIFASHYLPQPQVIIHHKSVLPGLMEDIWIIEAKISYALLSYFSVTKSNSLLLLSTFAGSEDNIS